MIIFFNPGMLLLVVLLVVVGVADIFFSSLSTIILTCLTLCFFVGGMYMLFTPGQASGFFGKISRSLMGILFASITFYIAVMFELGKGTATEKTVKYPLLEMLHMQNINEDFVYLILTVIIMIAAYIISLIAEFFSKKHKFLSETCSLLLIGFIAGIYVGGFKIAVTDAQQNSRKSFDFEMEKYEVLSDTSVYVEIDPFFIKTRLMKTSTIQSGTKVYASGHSLTKNGKDYYMITDDKQIFGYVAGEDLKSSPAT